MTVPGFVSYMAPIFWFSPDDRPRGARTEYRSGMFPGEPRPDRPCCTNQVNRVLRKPGQGRPRLLVWPRTSTRPGRSRRSQFFDALAAGGD